LQIEPDNSFVHLSLADYYRTKGEKEKSFNELKLAFTNKNMEAETKLRILFSYSNLVAGNKEMMDQALELCKIFIETNPNESKAHAAYGGFLYQNENFKDSHTQFEEALKTDKKSFEVWANMLEDDNRLSDFDLMLKESEEAITLFPTQPSVYLYNGVAKLQKDKNDDAIEALKTGLNLVVDNNDLKERFEETLGESYYKLKKYKESDEAFEKALELSPKNVFVLNNYSYYLSLRGEKLDKAEAMSKQSNDIRPNTPSNQDTYGWILYKEGKYADAKIWIQKALDNGGVKNAVILEHMGDILFKLDDTSGALKYWQDAKIAGKGSEFLDKKIADKKLYE
jgi:tetratricopeptide (TPR) repeat protein